MNAKNAIETLLALECPSAIVFSTEIRQALKLGIEALEQTEQDRIGNPLIDGELLPSETDD